MLIANMPGPFSFSDQILVESLPVCQVVVLEVCRHRLQKCWTFLLYVFNIMLGFATLLAPGRR